VKRERRERFLGEQFSLNGVQGIFGLTLASGSISPELCAPGESDLEMDAPAALAPAMLPAALLPPAALGPMPKGLAALRTGAPPRWLSGWTKECIWNGAVPWPEELRALDLGEVRACPCRGPSSCAPVLCGCVERGNAADREIAGVLVLSRGTAVDDASGCGALDEAAARGLEDESDCCDAH